MPRLILVFAGRTCYFVAFVMSRTPYGIFTAYQTENWNPNEVIDCGSVNGYRPGDSWEMACRFDIVELGSNCVVQQNFGFEDGQPCVLFNMERVCTVNTRNLKSNQS